MEQTRGQCRLRARVERLFEMLFAARAARRDYRHADFVRDAAGYLDVEAGLFAVGVHAGKQYFARAQPNRAHRPFLREGVQRDILPLVEGSTVSTKYGPVKTDHILFMAAGAFHVSKVSDLIPELQGRFPVRVELKPLNQEDYRRILTQPENALIRQYQALLGVDNIKLVFEDDALDKLAELAYAANETNENIGARRLHTLMEGLLQEISYYADGSEAGGEPIEVRVNAEYVMKHLPEISIGKDLHKYIL